MPLYNHAHLVLLDGVQLLAGRRHHLANRRMIAGRAAGEYRSTGRVLRMIALGYLRCGRPIHQTAVLLDAQMIAWRRHRSHRAVELSMGKPKERRERLGTFLRGGRAVRCRSGCAVVWSYGVDTAHTCC